MDTQEHVIINIFNEGSQDLPVYARRGDAGMDVRASKDISIAAGETVLVPTGLYFGLPEGWEIQIRPRSGMSLKTKLRISNGPGTLDQNYTGELCILLDNIGKVDTTVTKGERIAQIIAKRVPQIIWNSVDSKEELGYTNRGTAGFGSSGSH